MKDPSKIESRLPAGIGRLRRPLRVRKLSARQNPVWRTFFAASVDFFGKNNRPRSFPFRLLGASRDRTAHFASTVLKDCPNLNFFCGVPFRK
jgi:hypothetical protein